MSLLGCIADDYTGGADVAAALRRGGLRTALLFGRPETAVDLTDCDAVVVALKTRTAPATTAIAETLQVRSWMAGRGADRVYFKYCSTFDSTPQGNIGVVADGLLDADGSRLTVVCPSTPDQGRTVHNGHLFVGDVPLSESPMRDHPLTPMTDSDLVRVLGAQTPHRVGLVGLPVVRRGADAVRSELAAMRHRGVRYAVTDALTEEDLRTVARAATGLTTLTGAAGLAHALAGTLGAEASAKARDTPEIPAGPALVLAGSCSRTTLEQVDRAREHLPAHRLDLRAVPDPERLHELADDWLREHADGGPLLVYSSAPPEERTSDSASYERILAALARSAVQLGYRRLVVAGGETSGAVVNALGVTAVAVTGEADRGVPWCVHDGDPPVALLLKSGNFGRPDLLTRAAQGRS
ncbi:3-oxo-tetronate kinase [Saccharopolyspora sp. SCSIO 74807]|uniref:3-oxo-tetronate kinase n=1 Tax=Saccharopolyspora sp. SCSIO 74807 TaxID=3118084 RepID=UPI0030D5CACE